MKKIALILLIAGFFVACGSDGDNKTMKDLQQPSKEKQAIPDVNLKIAVIEIGGMTCEGCENTIKTKLAKVKGVVEVQASFAEGTAKLKYDDRKFDINKAYFAVEAAGYKANSYQLDVKEE